MKTEKQIQIMFRATEAERRALKILAVKKGKTVQAIVLSALDNTFPGWRKESK